MPRPTGRGLVPPHTGARKGSTMESTEYRYNELTGQWERVAGVEVVEDTYKETRDFEHFEI